MPEKAADGAPSRWPDLRPPRATVAVHREFYAMSSGRVATTRCCVSSRLFRSIGTVSNRDGVELLRNGFRAVYAYSKRIRPTRIGCVPLGSEGVRRGR